MFHCWTASAKKWNEQRCITDNWMKCKCKHLQMKQLEMQVQTFSNATSWQTLQNQMQTLTQTNARRFTSQIHTPRLFKSTSAFSASNLNRSLAWVDISRSTPLKSKGQWTSRPKAPSLILSYGMGYCTFPLSAAAQQLWIYWSGTASRRNESGSTR